MVPLLLLLLPLLWGGSLQQQPGYQYELRVQESVTVHEGLCVHVPCSFSYPWSSWSLYSPVYTYWYRDGDNTNRGAPVASNNSGKRVKTETRGRFLFENARTNSCSLSITEARRSDAGRYFFRMEIGDSVKYNYREKMLNLQVTDKPHIHIPEPLESGRPTELTCSLPGSCVRGQRFTFWAGAAVDSLAPQTRRSSVLPFTPRPRDHGTNLSCQVQVQWPQLTTQRTIRLNVSYAPQNLTIGVSFRNATALKILQTTSLPILEGQALRLICVADSNPPAKLSWFWGSPGLRTTPISSTSILELPRMGPAQEGEFTCQAWNPLGSQSVCLSLSVVYPPQLLGPSCSWEDQGLHCSCSSRAQPAPSLRWRVGEGLLEGNHDKASHVVTSHWVGPWTNSSLSLCVGLSPDLRLSCEARNEHGVQSASVLLLPGQGLLGAEATEKRVGQREGGAGGGGLLRDRGDVRTGPTISCPSGSYSGFCKEVGRGETESWEWVVSPELVLEEQALSPCRPQHQGSRRAPRGAGGSGEFNLRDQHPLGSQHVSFSLSVQSSPHSSTCVTKEQQGSWPLVFTLIRGALMGAGFLLTYVLTWLYYTRCGGPRNRRQSS